MNKPNTDQATVFDVARWVRDARRGSQPAFSQLYRRFAPLVHGILLGRHRPAVAGELTQECFATAFDRLAQLKEAHKFGPWIAIIARRMRSTDNTREFQTVQLPEIDSAAASPETTTEAIQVLQMVTALPEAYRETLLLRLVEGLSGPEIAELTGLTPESVRVNLHRGMEKLRQALGVDRPHQLEDKIRHG